MTTVLAVSASPSTHSKTAALCETVLARLRGTVPGVARTDHLLLRTVDGSALLAGRATTPSLADALQRFQQADGIVLATPIFKASYSGLLKAYLDLLPQFALAGKVVLPLATGGSLAHVLALDYALRPVLQSMGARHIVQSFYLHEAQMSVTDEGLEIQGEADRVLDEAIHHFGCALTTPVRDALLGHPRPERVSRMATA